MFDLLVWEIPSHTWWSRMGKINPWYMWNSLIMLWGQKLFFFWKLWKIFIRLPFHSSQPLGGWVFVRTQALRGGSSGIKSLSSCYPPMLLNHCRFSRYVYEILQESEVDPKVLDDPFKRSKSFETWNRYNNEGMGLGLIWERYSSFCLNEDNSRGISKSQIILILCVSKNALGSWTDWNKVEVYYCYFFMKWEL